MADIAGIGGGASPFAFNPARSTTEDAQVRDTQARDTAVRQRVQDEQTPNARPVEGDTTAPREAPPSVEESSPDQQQTADRGAPELTEDTVSLSAGAEQALTADTAADTANAAQSATPTPGETNATGTDTRATNQVTRQEQTTAEVNGNQDSQSEGTRTLGQVVDQFA
jgi:hypothetical protein